MGQSRPPIHERSAQLKAVGQALGWFALFIAFAIVMQVVHRGDAEQLAQVPFLLSYLVKTGNEHRMVRPGAVN